MGSRRMQRLLGKRGHARRVPRREVVLRLLQAMPEKYRSVMEHSLLCELAAKEIAVQLKAKGTKVSPAFVSRAALAHDSFRQLAEADAKEWRVATSFFSRNGFPEFAEALSPTHTMQNFDKIDLKKLSLEKKIIIYVDGVCRGIPVKDSKGEVRHWRNNIFSFREAFQTVIGRLKSGELRGEKRKILGEFLRVLQIERELAHMGLDTKKMVSKVRKKFKERN